MVANPTLAPDHGMDAPQRPPLRLEAGRACATPEHGLEVPPLRPVQLRRSTSMRSAPQRRAAPVLERVLPLRNGLPTDAEPPGDLAGTQPAGSQQARAFESAGLQLGGRQRRWSPYIHPTPAPAAATVCVQQIL
jgi:hypothetical protein